MNMSANCLDNLLRVKRLPLKTVGYFRIANRDNRTGEIQIGRWWGCSLLAIYCRVQEWRAHYPDMDAWIEVQMGDMMHGESDIWTVDVERDA